MGSDLEQAMRNHTTTGPRDGANRGESGMLLIAAMLFAITLFGLTAAILASGVAAQSEKRYVLASQKASEATESGVHLALGRIKTPGTPAIPDAGLDLAYTIGGTGSRATRLAIEVVPGAGDGADNDLDGVVDEYDEREMYEIIATGRHDNVGRALRVTIRRSTADLLATSPIMIGDSLATTDYSGSQHLVSGELVDINGSPVASVPSASAIGVAGDPALVTAQLPKFDTIVGDPKVTEIPPLDLGPLITYGKANADLTLTPPPLTDPDPALRPDPKIPGHWGTIDDPRLIVVEGDALIESSDSGAGVLIIDGDVDIGGGFEWTGVIIANGKALFRGGGTGTRLIGGALIQGSSDPSDIDFEITGTVDVLYSPEAILRMLGVLFGRRYDTLKWRTARVVDETSP